jgi:hypothetical protein
MQHISFVSYIVTLAGDKIEPDRVYAIAEWTKPPSVCNIKVFLGAADIC